VDHGGADFDSGWKTIENEAADALLKRGDKAGSGAQVIGDLMNGRR